MNKEISNFSVLTTDAIPLLPEISNLTITSSTENNTLESVSPSSSSTNNRSSDQFPTLPARPYRTSSSSDTCTTASTDVTSFSYNRLRDEHVFFEDEWTRVNKYLHFNVSEYSENEDLWKRLAISLFDKIESWKEEKLLTYKPTVWDFCILHTQDEIDQEIVQEFLKHLELEGLIGTSLTNLDIGQEKFEVSSNILNNSSRIFILNSIPFSQSGFHRFQYQESMMRKIHFQDWNRKIIPLHPSDEYIQRYKKKYPLLSTGKGFFLFGLSSTVGICLGNRTKTIENVRLTLTTDIQEINDKRRRKNKENYKYAIESIFKSKCKNLCSGLNDLKQQFQHPNFTTEQLAMMCIECENLQALQLWEDGPDQIIRLGNCSEISIGPSFHFNISS